MSRIQNQNYARYPGFYSGDSPSGGVSPLTYSSQLPQASDNGDLASLDYVYFAEPFAMLTPGQDASMMGLDLVYFAEPFFGFGIPATYTGQGF